jgi:hypothetical protein
VTTERSENVPLIDEPLADEVTIPRALAREMTNAMEAMQLLASEGMAEVAKALGLVARRRPLPPLPDCPDCGLDVGLGLPHHEDCVSDEALRYRVEDIPQFEDEA